MELWFKDVIAESTYLDGLNYNSVYNDKLK